MASYSVFWAGFVIFIVFAVNAYVVSFFGGFFIDSMFGVDEDELEDLPGYDNPTAVAMREDGMIWFFVNFFYFLMYAWPILGGIIWGQSILKRGGNSQYQQGRF